LYDVVGFGGAAKNRSMEGWSMSVCVNHVMCTVCREKFDETMVGGGWTSFTDSSVIQRENMSEADLDPMLQPI
jgi:hypothetical protein